MTDQQTAALQTLNELLNPLCIKLQGLELTHIIRAPAGEQWAVRGLRDPKDPARPYDGDSMTYSGATPGEALTKALADNP